MNEKNIVKQEFYQRCGEVLGIDHIYKTPYSRITRWNNRDPGNGRYLGWGIIRRYSSTNIHVCHAGLSKLFDNEQSVITYLQDKK